MAGLNARLRLAFGRKDIVDPETLAELFADRARLDKLERVIRTRANAEKWPDVHIQVYNSYIAIHPADIKHDTPTKTGQGQALRKAIDLLKE